MIEMMMEFLGEIVLVRIDGTQVLFGNTQYGARLASIDGLKLDYNGVIKEFPELKGNENWKEEAIKKFKEKIKKMKSEKEIATYLIEDLDKFGYKAKKIQQSGFRTKTL